MKIIAFALQKGGVGKTSMSVSVAYELAKKYKVVLVDTDSQGNATSWVLGDAPIAKELVDFLNKKADIKEVITKTNNPNLFIVPTASLGGELREYQATKAPLNPYAISDLTDKLKPFFDFCIIDTSPNFDPLNTSVFMASDEIVNVLQLNDFSKEGLQIFNENFESMKERYRLPENKSVRDVIILNGYDKRKAEQNLFLDFYKEVEKLGYKVFIVPSDTAFDKAQRRKITIEETKKVKKETLEVIANVAREIIR